MQKLVLKPLQDLEEKHLLKPLSIPISNLPFSNLPNGLFLEEWLFLLCYVF